jgi:hypothetical protein
MRLSDIAIITNTPLETDRVLLEKFKHHDRVAYDPKTDLYSYKVFISSQYISSLFSPVILARLQCSIQTRAADRDPAPDTQRPRSFHSFTQGVLEGSASSY